MANSVPDRVLRFDADKPLPATPRKREVTADTAAEVAEASKLPRPTGYRILLLPYTPPEKTKGGIYRPDEVRQKEDIATVCGYVCAVGPDAYKDPAKFPEGPWCSEGDWVIFGRYAGARFNIEGGDMRLLNDDEILAIIDNPEDVELV